MRDPLLFALAVATILGVPGPTNTLLAAAGASMGFARAILLIPAETAGYLCAICALGFVLGPGIAAVPAATIGLRGAIAAYLAALAWRMWRAPGPAETAGAPIGPRTLFTATLLNPKAVVFAFGVIPFGAADVALYLGGFLVLATAAALAWVAAGAALGQAAGRGGRALVGRLSAVAVGGFAAMLAVSLIVR